MYESEEKCSNIEDRSLIKDSIELVFLGDFDRLIFSKMEKLYPFDEKRKGKGTKLHHLAIFAFMFFKKYVHQMGEVCNLILGTL